MEDSFFGFDTSLPADNDEERRLGEGSEEEYDALNDETFGAAVNGDWEEDHENLVRRLGNSKEAKSDPDENESSDLEINLSRVKLDDVEICSDDNECRIVLDPSVWSNTIKHTTQTNLYPNPEAFLRQNFPNPFESLESHVQVNRFFNLNNSLPRKICTVEDIERNIRNQQQQQQQMLQAQNAKSKTTQSSTQQQQLPQPHTAEQVNHAPMQQPPPPPPPTQQPQQQQQQQIPQHANNFFNRAPVPPGFIPPRPPNFNVGPMNLHPGPQPPHRMPPGFSPLPLLGGHNINAGSHHNFPRPMPHNLPIALNNFAMHPNFNAMRPIGPPIPPPRLPQHPGMINNTLPTAINQFNQRLVQEIQQNHPMLANSRVHNHMYNTNSSHQQNHNNYQSKQNTKHNPRSNGNPEEYDEYANLMSTRDKHWLIGIQLSQLNTDTPYIDDYYYTVFKERKAKLNGESQSKTHVDNQLNHPLTQPKGHAQLVLISMGKNGTNIRNGQNRERKNSDTKNDKDQNQRFFSPLQFENSLGKLQYCSVTAPRKIIDMEVMGIDSSPQFNTSIELSTQRKSRQLLLHIETLYRIVLKLEDLQNPAAIATSLIIKEKREKEKQLALNQALIDSVNKAAKPDEKSESAYNSKASSLSEGYIFELEPKDKLLQKLIPCLSLEKIIGMMNVRKGKTLIRRIMPHIEDHPIRWNVWIGVFSSLPSVLKKDKDDAEGVLYAIYPEFKKQIRSAELGNVVTVAKAIPLNDKKLNTLFASKFCISSLVAILLRAEEIYKSTTKIDPEMNTNWCQFLSTLSASLNRSVQYQTISAAIESNAVQPMINHFSRFKELELDSLVALFSQTKQQTD